MAKLVLKFSYKRGLSSNKVVIIIVIKILMCTMQRVNKLFKLNENETILKERILFMARKERKTLEVRSDVPIFLKSRCTLFLHISVEIKFDFSRKLCNFLPTINN